MTMDRVTGCLVAALGVLVVWGASRLPAMPGQWLGPSAFPTLVGVGLVATGALIALGVGRGFEEGALDGAPTHDAGAHDAAAHDAPAGADPAAAGGPLWRAAIPVVLLVFYALVVEWLGFVPTAAAILLVMALALGARPRAALALAAVVAPAAHLVFGKLLRVPLAPGLLPMPW